MTKTTSLFIIITSFAFAPAFGCSFDNSGVSKENENENLNINDNVNENANDNNNNNNVVIDGCGDGTIDGDEECDDVNTVSGDGCSSECTIEEGWTCSGEPSVCSPICGDGIIVGEEECDDDNLTPGDGCSNHCTVEGGWECTGEPSACNTDCGDNIVAGDEECDDGNTSSGDGCSETCEIEDYFRCDEEPSVCTCVVHVRGGTSSGVPDGMTWSNAYTTVQEGITQAAALSSPEVVCEVWVVEGSYNIFEDSPDNTVMHASNVAIYGGFAGDETERSARDWEARETILNGNAESQHVITVADNTQNATMDGFTITNGFTESGGAGLYAINFNNLHIENCLFEINTANTGGGAYLSNGTATFHNCVFRENEATVDYGGGMYLEGMDLLMSNCTFENNTSNDLGGGLFISMAGNTVEIRDSTFGPGNNGSRGGAVYLDDENDLLIIDSVFQSNYSSDQGGALYLRSNTTIQNSQFINNESNYGGAVYVRLSSADIFDSYFNTNYANFDGGAIYAQNPGTSIHNTVINENNADDNGGGIALDNAELDIFDSHIHNNDASSGYGGGIDSWESNLYAEGCIFETNSSSNHGGGIYSRHGPLEIINSLFFANTSYDRGGGIRFRDNDNGSIINSLFYGNYADTGSYNGGAIGIRGATVDIINTIIWANSTDQISTYSATANVSYSDIQGGHSGDGNIDADPLFVDQDNGDFHLQSGSPCIDAANGDVAPNFDIEGNPHVDDPATDNTGIGASDYVDIGPYEFQP